MNNKNKNLQIIAALFFIFIVGLSIYYFASYLPRQEILSLQKDCLILGDKKTKEYKEEQEKDSINTVRTDHYVFDIYSRNCIYKKTFIYIDNSGSLIEASMFDLFSNKELASYLEKGNNGYIIKGDKY